MTTLDQEKQQLIAYCSSFIEDQLNHVQTVIDSANESAKNESKSSAGDKHETGKSLLQLEQENNAQLLNNMLSQKRIISLLQNHEVTGQISLGSLVETDQGAYFIAIGIGKVQVKQKDYFVISPSSPVGLAFKNKKKGDEVTFNGKSMQILEVV